jgi:hypothetical protein
MNRIINFLQILPSVFGPWSDPAIVGPRFTIDLGNRSSINKQEKCYHALGWNAIFAPIPLGNASLSLDFDNVCSAFASVTMMW